MMAKTRTIFLGALNIAATPHPPGTYERLIEAIRDHRVRAYGQEWAHVSTARSATEKGLPHVYWGQVFFYTELDQGGAWFDLLARLPASERAMGEIRIPENLRPNLRAMRYFFDVADHKLYFELKNERGERFTAKKVQRVFDRIFKELSTIKGLPEEVAVSIVPTHDAIEKVLAVPNLAKLVIRLERPNADDIGSATRRLMKRLQSQGAARQDVVLTKSKSANKLTPDHDTKELAEVAAENGFVQASGTTDDGLKAVAQTSDYPREYQVQLTESEDPLDALFAFIQHHAS